MPNQAREWRFLVVTAFDTRYEVGYLCSVVNEAYCKRHGYAFRRVLPSPEGMSLLSGHRHCAWGKVALVHHLLGGKIPTEAAAIAGPRLDDVDYVVWVDADAMVLNHDKRLEEFVEAAGAADFIVGEDMADTDYLNTGLFFCRCGSSWMRRLMQRWWADSDSKWHFEVCWDQTGLCRLLEKEDGLGQQKPWFSWQGGLRRKPFGDHSFVYDCGAFNFKYINNCDFVFHAVGERELIFSFSRQLSLKRERLYFAVEKGFVDGGIRFKPAEDWRCVDGGRSEEVRSRLSQAHALWEAHGAGGRGRRGRAPPIGWDTSFQDVGGGSSGSRVMRVDGASGGESALAVEQNFVVRSSPLVLGAAWSASEEQSWSGISSLESLIASCGDLQVTLLRVAPMRGPDAVDGRLMYRARLWQLCDYALGRAPPLNPLCYNNPSCTWRAFGWKPWEGQQGGQAAGALRSLSEWAPSAVRATVSGFADSDAAASLDVEPPGAVTRLHRDMAHLQLVVLCGQKEFLLVRPDDSHHLRPGFGTCDPDQSPCDPADPQAPQLPAAVTPVSAVLRAGDVLLVPRGWWCWARARSACVTQRRSFTDLRILQEVVRRQQARHLELQRSVHPAPELLARLREAKLEGRAGHDGAIWLDAGAGPVIAVGHFAAIHFVVHGQDGQATECSRMMPHPCVVEAAPPIERTSPELASAPVAIREAKARGILACGSGRAGARCCFFIHDAVRGRDAMRSGPVFVVLEIVEVMERGPGRAGLRPISGPHAQAGAADPAGLRPVSGPRAQAGAPPAARPAAPARHCCRGVKGSAFQCAAGARVKRSRAWAARGRRSER